MTTHITKDLHDEKLNDILTEVGEYIINTYGEHYVGDDDLQVLDFFETFGNEFQGAFAR